MLRLEQKLPASVGLKRILGGLAQDSDLPMPEKMQRAIKHTWSMIEQTIPGVRFNFEFWSANLPRRSTYPACRAVLAARQQGMENDERMIRAIQSAYYVQARNPSDLDVLIQLADENGLDLKQFKNDIISQRIEDQLMEDIKFSRQLNVSSFPSLILYCGDEYIPIPHDYLNEYAMLDVMHKVINMNRV